LPVNPPQKATLNLAEAEETNGGMERRRITASRRGEGEKWTGAMGNRHVKGIGMKKKNPIRCQHLKAKQKQGPRERITRGEGQKVVWLKIPKDPNNRKNIPNKKKKFGPNTHGGGKVKRKRSKIVVKKKDAVRGKEGKRKVSGKVPSAEKEGKTKAQGGKRGEADERPGRKKPGTAKETGPTKKNNNTKPKII